MIPIPRGGILRSVSGTARARDVTGIEDVMITIPAGERVVPLPEGDRYLGFIFARAPDSRRIVEAHREAHRRLEFEIQPVDTPTRAQ